MPFDRLPGHSLKTPEFNPIIPPPRPVVPWAQYIVPAVDKIAQSLVYSFSPYERQMRQAELSKARVGQMQAQQQMQLAPQTMDLQRREIAMREKEIGFRENLYNRIGKDGSMPQGYVLGSNMQPQYNPAKAHEQDITHYNDSLHATAEDAIRRYEATNSQNRQQPAMSSLKLQQPNRMDSLSRILIGDDEDDE